MNDRIAPRQRVATAIGKCRMLIDPESGNGISLMGSDRRDLLELAAMPDADKQIQTWIKRKLRPYVETWILGELEPALEKLSRK